MTIEIIKNRATIVAEVTAIGTRYLETHPSKTFWHSNHDKAQRLIAIANNEEATAFEIIVSVYHICKSTENSFAPWKGQLQDQLEKFLFSCFSSRTPERYDIQAEITYWVTSMKYQEAHPSQYPRELQEARYS